MFKKACIAAFVSLTGLALPMTGLQAKTVWKCGEGGRAYSESPCPGGKAVNVADVRSSADVRTAQDSVKRSQDLADRMRKQRLEDERRNLVANAGAANLGPHKAPVVKPDAAVKTKKKAKPPRRHPRATAEEEGTLRSAAASSQRKRD